MAIIKLSQNLLILGHSDLVSSQAVLVTCVLLKLLVTDGHFLHVFLHIIWIFESEHFEAICRQTVGFMSLQRFAAAA